MATTGKCHCGAISWSAEGPAEHHAVCHCGDCRRWSGAPMVGWIAWPADRVSISGETARYHSSQHGTREFCGACGTGLFYRNREVLPGIIDIQSAHKKRGGSRSGSRPAVQGIPGACAPVIGPDRGGLAPMAILYAGHVAPLCPGATMLLRGGHVDARR